MQVKIKRLNENSVIPQYAKEGDAGMDLMAVTKEWDNDNSVWVYGTGLSFEIPKGHVGLLFPRSSIFKQDLRLSNSVGVIDSGYRGEVLFKFKETLVLADQHELVEPQEQYEIGDRVGQIIILPYPQIEFVEAEELSETERGSDGYGSSGR